MDEQGSQDGAAGPELPGSGGAAWPELLPAVRHVLAGHAGVRRLQRRPLPHRGRPQSQPLRQAAGPGKLELENFVFQRLYFRFI